MNDQRQVIFSQRIKLLNSKDITHMLDGFIDDFQQEIKELNRIIKIVEMRQNLLMD